MGGLKLRGAAAIDVGTCSVVHLQGVPEDLYGHVRWRRGDRLGFRFDLPLLREDLFNLLNGRP